jgi:hypothetical protein
MDQVTQQNAALVEEAAAAAESLDDQARGLLDAMSFFVTEQAVAPRAAAPSAQRHVTPGRPVVPPRRPMAAPPQQRSAVHSRTAAPLSRPAASPARPMPQPMRQASPAASDEWEDF